MEQVPHGLSVTKRVALLAISPNQRSTLFANTDCKIEENRGLVCYQTQHVNPMTATPDAFFVDITSELNSTGATWEDIVAFMKLRTVHPLRRSILQYGNEGSAEVDDLLGRIPSNLTIYKIREDVPSFLVHRGALSTVRKMFRLPHSDWRMDDVIAKIKKGEFDQPRLRTCDLQELSDRANTLYYETAAKRKDNSEAAQKERASFFQQHFEKVELIASVLEAELLIMYAFDEVPKE